MSQGKTKKTSLSKQKFLKKKCVRLVCDATLVHSL